MLQRFFRLSFVSFARIKFFTGLRSRSRPFLTGAGKLRKTNIIYSV